MKNIHNKHRYEKIYILRSVIITGDYTFEITAPDWVGIVVGFIIGAFAELWGIANPETLIRLSKWEDRLFITCVLLGAGVSAIIMYGLFASGVFMHFSAKPLYIIGVSLGGAIFGVGLAISGYFPGSIWMALGEGRRDALYAVAGALLGAASWTLLYQIPAGQWLITTDNLGSIIITGNNIHDLYSIRFLIFGVAVAYGIVFFLISYFLPRFKGGSRSCIAHLTHSTPKLMSKSERKENSASVTLNLKSGKSCAVSDEDVKRYEDTADYLMANGIGYKKKSFSDRLVHNYTVENNTYAWFMIIVASAVGLAVVLDIFLHQIFGESTTDSWLAGYLFLPTFRYSQLVFNHIGWEPFSDIGTLMGAFFSSVFISRRFTAFRKSIPPSWAKRFGNSEIKRSAGVFIGAYLMLFGARMADGCASGHILSGAVQMAASGLWFGVFVIGFAIITAKIVYR